MFILDIVAINFNKLEKEIKERGEVIHLDNGATLIFEHVPNFGLNWGNYTIFAGAFHEKEENSGIMHFLEHMTFGDSKNGKEQEIQTRENILGLQKQGLTGQYNTVFPIAGNNASNYLLSTNFGDAFDIVTERVFNPLFTEDNFKRELEVVKKEFNDFQYQKNINPYNDISKQINKKLFSANPKILRDIIGTKKSLENITIEKLREHHSKFYTGNNVLFNAIGDFSNTNLKKKIISQIEKIPQGKKIPSLKFKEQDLYLSREQYSIDFNLGSDDLVEIYFKIPNADSLDSVPVPSIRRILTGGLNGLLYDELRYKNNLLYSINAESIEGPKTHYLRVRYTIPSDKLEKSIELVTKGIDRLKKGAFEDSLFDACKASQLPQILNNLQQPGWINGTLTERYNGERFGRETTSLEQIQTSMNLTKKDVVDFANKYLNERYVAIVKHRK